MIENRDLRLSFQDDFSPRHIGLTEGEIQEMLGVLGLKTLEDLVEKALPQAIRRKSEMNIPSAKTEHEALQELRGLAQKNQVFRSFLGMGYSDCLTPAVIQRNILENPGWYTQYTPYQAEIAQGRLEALINFQTMISDLTGLPLSNASLLDEGTAAAEAMFMAFNHCKKKRAAFFVSKNCHPQTIAVIETRAEPLGIQVVVEDATHFDFENQEVFGGLFQFPCTDGQLQDPTEWIASIQKQGGLGIVATDLLALTLLKTPGEMKADIAIGNSQRFGVPLGFGGPHAAFMSTQEEWKRMMPGRLVGVSVDAQGNLAYRLALQTREQHIKRDKATSNICTSQVLLAIIASMYAVYHGKEGLQAIARKVHSCASVFLEGIQSLGYQVVSKEVFDTVTVEVGAGSTEILRKAREARFNLRDLGNGLLGVSFDEVTSSEEIQTLLSCFCTSAKPSVAWEEISSSIEWKIPTTLERTTDFLQHPVFKNNHKEHELLRYIHRLQSKDLSLTHSMISLGSCTMKLNATSEMLPISWPEFSKIHPFVPQEQTVGYREMFAQLEQWLSEITGFAATSLQPNAGSQGEYAGLLTIRAYHKSRGKEERRICLIPVSAHGTNPASAALAGFEVVIVQCNANGDISVPDLREKAEKHKDRLAALMVTYPSTHGVFEENIREVCDIVHQNGGLVYLDGANMNAQVGLSSPGEYGADVCHLNLHKTFCIPHGGGGPGMGPICVAKHLVEFLPSHPLTVCGGEQGISPVSSAAFGSASILPISWMYIRMMGREGLKKATQVAILNANYMAHQLKEDFDVLFRGKNDLVAHEFILDIRPFKATTKIEAVDIAKRLMDYGFHAPTMSFPVANTLMIEPTESESKAELDRFVATLKNIRKEIQEVEEGQYPVDNNVLVHSPHSAKILSQTEWPFPYPREKAGFALPWVQERKFWVSISRINDAYGDRNLFCSCPPIE